MRYISVTYVDTQRSEMNCNWVTERLGEPNEVLHDSIHANDQQGGSTIIFSQNTQSTGETLCQSWGNVWAKMKNFKNWHEVQLPLN